MLRSIDILRPSRTLFRTWLNWSPSCFDIVNRGVPSINYGFDRFTSNYLLNNSDYTHWGDINGIEWNTGVFCTVLGDLLMGMILGLAALSSLHYLLKNISLKHHSNALIGIDQFFLLWGPPAQLRQIHFGDNQTSRTDTFRWVYQQNEL